VNSSTGLAQSNGTGLRTKVLIAFGCVYFFWGSTFVAIRFGVQVLPPFVLGAMRYILSGGLMLLFCRVRGISLRLTGREALLQALIGVLLLTGGNVGLMYAEQTLASGLSSLIIAVIPLYVALFEAVAPRGEGLRAKGWAGIAAGFAGLLILLWPGLREGLRGNKGQMVGAIFALGCALSWTIGTIIARRCKMAVSPFASAGWQMFLAGLVNGAVMLTLGDWHRAQWGVQAYGSVLYLVTFGSLIGYTAYIYLLEHVPVAKVATYAYINPIVAVALGAVFLHERMVGLEYVGMAAILLAVWLVTSSKLKTGTPLAEVECVAAEEIA
jgi:drug/metabolite transporter (DMT)-like permease